MDNKIEVNVAEELFDRVEKEGVMVIKVKDGFVMGFSKGHLERMLKDAESSPEQRVIMFIKTPSENQA